MTSLSILNVPPVLLEGLQSLHKLIRWDEHGRTSTALDFLGADGRRWKYSYSQLRAQVTGFACTVEQSVEAADDDAKFNQAEALGKRTIVPLLLPQSPALYISILAILEVGAAFCPISLDSPSERIKFVVKDVQARVVITTKEHEAMMTWKDGPKVIVIDEYPSSAIGLVPDLFQSKRLSSSEDLAYIMYTSGSSGAPKGVALSHLAATQSLLAHDSHLPVFNRFLQFAAPSFDVSVFEIFFPLFRGATLVGCNREVLLNDLTGIINQLDIDAVELTPTVAGSLVQSRENVPRLKLILTIGEMLTRPVVDEFGSSKGRDGILYGMYGPTEAAIHCAINARIRVGDKVGNIGVPFPTVSTFVCTIIDSMTPPSQLNILPVGEIGELVLAGPQLAECYLNRSEQNAAAFIMLKGEPAYRTGDKARQYPNGTLEILGRISSGQVKLRGQRAELGEIEEAVYKCSIIKTAVASVMKGVLVVFALTREDGVTEMDVLKACAKWLPKFMTPSEIVFLESFPYLPSGKVDKRKLEKDYAEKQEAEKQPHSSRKEISATESIVGGVVRELLGVDVDYNLRLASVGLDSLMAIRLASTLRDKGINLSAVQILQADTLTSLTMACASSGISTECPQFNERFDFGELLSNVCESSQSPFSLEDIDYVMPCTALQEAMLSETAINASAYMNQVEIDIRQDLDGKEIQRAFQSLAQRNAILRTMFVECGSANSVYSQVVLKALPLSQITNVDVFSHATSNQNLSASHPFQAQVKRFGDKSKVLINIHHALYDAWSLELMLDDLESILINVEPSPRTPFRVLVEEECRSANTESWLPEKEYWQDHLNCFDPRTIPNFHTLLDDAHRLETFHFDTSISTHSLEGTARLLCVSSQSVFQAAYALLLSSYLGTQDVCFGTVFSGRTSAIPGIAEVVGPCLSTLPVRMDLSSASTLGDLAQQMNATNRKHLKHAAYPLREIKKTGSINPGRSLFDSLLVWQQTLREVDFEREHVRLVDSTDNLEFNLTLEITPTRRNVHIKAIYQANILPEQQLEFLLRQVEHIVMTLIRDPMMQCHAIFSELDESLQSICHPAPITVAEGSLSASVEFIAENSPDRVAIEFAHSIADEGLGIERMTYCDLNSQANRIANYLIMCGVLPDDLVCIMMEKSVELYISILGSIKASAGYLPLTPDTPLDRLLKIISEANVKTIITHSSLAEKLKGTSSVELVLVDKLDLTSLSPSNAPLEAKSANLAYCVFTSGSTGTPKGVLITRGNLMSNLVVLSDLYPHSVTSKLLQSCSQAFDVSVFEIFFTWHIGGTLCSAIKDVAFRDMELTINKFGITHLSLTPSVAALVDPSKVPKVEFLVTAGEAVTEKVFTAWAGRRLWQGYGPSETTNICTVRPNVRHDNQINNIGPPLRNTSAFVLAPGDGVDFTLVPRGAEGEFCFGGEQVGRGYLDRKQEEGRFFQHPKYQRLYRSGDFGRLLPDGSLAFTGRKDDQVKIRGQRVELGEINAVLLRQEAVSDCVTMIVKDGTDQSPLVAFWTNSHETMFRDCQKLEPDPQIIDALFSALALSLPAYMLPSALIPVSHFPSTSQGKIDKRQLSKLFRSIDNSYLSQVSAVKLSAKNCVRASSEMERRVAGIIAESARLPWIDIVQATSFFSLGIDSISAISLSRSLRRELGIQVEISDVLNYASVSRLAEQLEKKPKKGLAVVKALTIGGDDFELHFNPAFIAKTIEEFARYGQITHQIRPCTPLQEAMLSAADISLNPMAYRNHVSLSLHVSNEMLQIVWRLMVERHEILRTCFVKTPDPKTPYAQIVLSQYVGNLTFINGTKSVAKIRDDLDRGVGNFSEWEPPYSITVVRDGSSSYLLISMHHALYDGFAMSILYEEMEMSLRGQELQPPVSFAPFLTHMLKQIDQRADDYWGDLLQDFTPRPFVLAQKKQAEEEPSVQKHARGPKEKQIVRVIQFVSSSSLTGIGDAVKRNNVSLLSVCQAAWTILLSRYLVQADVCFGNVVSGRTVPVDGIDRLVAPCFNTIPVRVKDVHKMSYIDLFRKLQQQMISCLPFQLTPLRRTQSQHGTGPLFDTLVILQPPARKLDSSIWTMTDDSGFMDLPVVMEVVPQPENDTLQLVLHIHASVLLTYDPSEMLEEYDSILQRSLSTPRNPVMSAFARAEVEKDAITVMEAKAKINPVEVYDAGERMSNAEREIFNVIAEFTDTPRKNIRKGMSIYKLGLDSISAVQIASSLRKMGRMVMASDVLEHPSIEQLAAYVSVTPTSPKNRAVPVIDFRDFDADYRRDICARTEVHMTQIEAIRPCTAVQAGMLAQTLHSLDENRDNLDYINSFCIKLDRGIHVSRMLKAWSAVVNGTEMLRTGFVAVEPSERSTHKFSKYPFAMVTYKNDSAKLPVIAAGENASRKIFHFLSTSPWNLQVSAEGPHTFINFTAHHALYDAKSLELILSEVARQYFSENAAIQKLEGIDILLSAILTAADENELEREAFWREQANKISDIRFPDLTPLRESCDGHFVCELASSLSVSDIEYLCRQHNASIQALGQAAWGRLLAAYTGETLITFGVTLSGRSVLDGSENIPFPSIVTVPVSQSITGSNHELLEHFVRKNAEMNKHQFTPLNSIQKWAGDGSGGKMFDTLFLFQKMVPVDTGIKAPWKIVQERANVDYAASMEIQPLSSGILRLRFTGREKLLSKEQANLLLNQYDALLRDTVEHGERQCASMELDPVLMSISPAATETLPSAVQLLHEFVELQAKENPLRVALEFTTNLDPGCIDTKSWNYEKLDSEGNRIANFLLRRTEHGLAGNLVAICFDKCPEASFAILGILKAGFAYVALDPNAPPGRLKFIMADSNSSLILTAGKLTEMLSSTFSGSTIEVINLGQEGVLEGIRTESPNPRCDVQPHDTCYCLYTSGTTGTPKGCEITHFNAVQAMLAFQHLFAGHWSLDSKWLQFASFHFDVSVLEQFWSWSVGICVASAPRDLIFEDIPRAIRKLGITHIDLTPSLARLLSPEDVPSLTRGVFITGGEQLKQEILDVWGEKGCIYNGYGPTEATIGVTMYPRVPITGKPTNIGPQFLNVGSFVLRPGTDEPVLRGGVGELCVSGALVGKGYLNRTDLTSERFRVLSKFDEKVYRTGDLVRILHNGDFLYLGRTDDQVKLRGQRLELTEINEVIKKNVRGLDEVATHVLKHALQQNQQLVTFFVPRSGDDSGGIEVGSIQEACVAHLPSYMVPSYFVQLKEMPLSANNKADVKVLAGVFNGLSIEDLQNLSSGALTTTAWTTEELTVLRILADHVGVAVELVLKSANIFELGLDSISVINLSRRLQKEGYHQAKLKNIMKNSSISSLAKLLASSLFSKPSQASNLAATQRIAAFSHRHIFTVAKKLGIVPSDIEAVAPCTPTQQGMVFEFLGSTTPVYFNQFLFKMADIVDLKRLENAWMRVIAKVQVLRTMFVLTQDGVAQVVIRPEKGDWKWRSDASIRKNFDAEIARDPRIIADDDKHEALQRPWKMSFLDSNLGDVRFMRLTIFHALYDGISLPLLLRNLAAEYDGLPDVNYGPSFHAVLPQGPLADLKLAEAEVFFKKHLSTWEMHNLPRIENPPSDTVTSISRVMKTLNLARLRQMLGVTDQAILQSAWASSLQSLTQKRNIAFGVVVSGRSIDFPGAENVIGPLLNTVPFTTMIDQGLTWSDLIKDCHEKNVEILPWQTVALKDIQKWVAGGMPLFETLFVFQTEGPGIDGKLWQEIGRDAIADYLVAFEAELRSNGDIQLTIVAKADVLSELAANELLNKVEASLTALQVPQATVPYHAVAANDSLANSTKRGVLVQGSGAALVNKRFEWTSDALAIKSEIEQLAGSTAINENVSIFELGLDSIDVIKLASRLKKYHIHLPVSTIVQNQTVAKMASLAIKRLSEKADVIVTKAIDENDDCLQQHLLSAGRLPDGAESVLPATPLQEGMIAEMLTSNYSRYFNHELYRVADEVDMSKLKAAWDSVIAKNDVLRTKFVEVDDPIIPVSFAQVICQPSPSVWQVVVVEREAIEVAAATLIREITETAKCGKDLLHLVELRVGGGSYFLLSIAHALYDGWSLHIIHRDVWQAYHGSLTRRVNHRRIVEGILNIDSVEAQSFWQTALTGLSRSEFPRRSSSQGTVHRVERESRIPLVKIQAFCRSAGISIQTLGQAAWALLLAVHLRRLDVVFGVVLSCRDSDDLSEFVFPLMNTVAVRAVLHGSILEFLRYMQENLNAMRTHQHFPLRRARVLAGVDGSLFDTMFVYQGRHKHTVEKKRRLYEAVYSVSEVEFVVCVEMELVDDSLVFRTACKDSALSEEGAETMLDNFDAVIRRIINFKGAIITSTGQGVSVLGLASFHIEAVASPEEKTQRLTGESTTIWTDTEKIVRNVLSQVSRISEDEINKDQTIFHLGLDSISAIKASSILRRHGIRLGVNEMTSSKSIRKLAEIVDGSVPVTMEPNRDIDRAILRALDCVDRDAVIRNVGAQPDNVEEILPISAGQLYMLSRWQLSGGTQFAGTFRFELADDFHQGKLEEAWRLAVESHPILRTVFAATEQVDHPFVQVVLKSVESTVEMLDSFMERKAQSFTSPVALSVHIDGDHCVLSLRILHALYDGISLPLLLDDLSGWYNEPSKTRKSSQGFRNFLSRSIDAKVEPRRKFWTQYLEGCPGPLISTEATTNQRIEVFSADISIVKLKSLAQRTGVSVDAMLLSVFAEVYSHHLNDLKEPSAAMLEHVVFGLYLANRSLDGDDLSRLVAPTLNLLPLRVDINADMTMRANRIQSDLQKIGSAENIVTSLKEISDWTGVTVDCFVNILKNAEQSVSAEGLLFKGLTIRPHLRQERAEIIEVKSEGELRAASNNSTARAYLPAVDFEMRVTDSGEGLDIGVFSPIELLDLEDARGLIGKIRDRLRGLE